MNLKQLAQRDIATITGNTNDFADEATLTKPTDPETNTTVNVIHTKHHLSLDTDGLPVNGKVASIAFSEDNIDESIRNVNNEVDLIDWKVLVKDSTGTDKQYIIREWFPDEMIGMIVCILGDFE